jgi:hypothetical protein
MELDDNTRTELVDYYKWIVSLAVFVLTISVALVRFLSTPLRHTWLVVIGWLLLGLCIFFNLLLVKRLVTIGAISRMPEEERGPLQHFYIATMNNAPTYANIQNAAFSLGVGCIAVGLLLNLLQGGGG